MEITILPAIRCPAKDEFPWFYSFLFFARSFRPKAFALYENRPGSLSYFVGI
ncbi:MAG: hypothetical protein HOD85_16385 [Deltaproteobacteria bacterium]|nr:hypothetical protein [Deltaproteobacteria bacterium]